MGGWEKMPLHVGAPLNKHCPNRVLVRKELYQISGASTGGCTVRTYATLCDDCWRDSVYVRPSYTKNPALYGPTAVTPVSPPLPPIIMWHLSSPTCCTLLPPKDFLRTYVRTYVHAAIPDGARAM